MKKNVTIAYFAQARKITSDNAIISALPSERVKLRSETKIHQLVDRENWSYKHDVLPAGIEVELTSVVNQGFNGINGFFRVGDWYGQADLNQLITTMDV